jgi:hypothetical protein
MSLLLAAIAIGALGGLIVFLALAAVAWLIWNCYAQAEVEQQDDLDNWLEGAEENHRDTGNH